MQYAPNNGCILVRLILTSRYASPKTVMHIGGRFISAMQSRRMRIYMDVHSINIVSACCVNTKLYNAKKIYVNRRFFAYYLSGACSRYWMGNAFIRESSSLITPSKIIIYCHRMVSYMSFHVLH